MSDTDNTSARSEEPALDGPESGNTKLRSREARNPDNSSPPSARRAKPKPLAIDLELYGRWTGNEYGEVF